MTRFCGASHEQARLLDASTPEYDMNGAFRSRLSWGYTELLCYHLSCTAARLGLATGGISRNWTQFHLRCLRKVLRVSWKDHVPNQEILRRAELTGIEAMLNLAQLRWSGYVTRMDDSRLPKQLFHAELSTGKWHKDRQRKRYKDVLKSTLKAYNIPVDEWQALGPRPAGLEGSQYAMAQSTLRKADDRAWMIRDRQGRTECQTLALLYLVSSAARSALPISGTKLICANTSTDSSSSKSKDYYYLKQSWSSWRAG